MFSQLIVNRFALAPSGVAITISQQSNADAGSDGIFRLCQIAAMAIICGFVLVASSCAFSAIT